MNQYVMTTSHKHILQSHINIITSTKHSIKELHILFRILQEDIALIKDNLVSISYNIVKQINHPTLQDM